MSDYPLIYEEEMVEYGCQNGLTSVGFTRERHGRAIKVYLWFYGGRALQVQCNMHDIGERVEVGSLQFQKVKSHSQVNETLTLPMSFSSIHKMERLVIEEDGKSVESGVVLTCTSGEELWLVSGAFPYTVEVSIPGFADLDFQPEYPINEYQRVAC